MGAHTNTRHSTTWWRRIRHQFGVAVIAMLLAMAGQLLLPDTQAAAKPGCKDYAKQEECRETAHWDGENIKFGDDTFIPRGPSSEIEKQAEDKVGKDLDFFAYCVSGNSVRCSEYSYIAIPSSNNSGDKIDESYLITTGNGEAWGTNVTSITTYENKDAEKKGIEDNIKKTKEKINKTREKLDQKTHECHTLKNQPNADPEKVKQCEEEIDNMLKEVDELESQLSQQDATLKDEDKKDGSTCDVGDGVGWIICPAASFLASMTDGAFLFLSTFLSYDTLTEEEGRTAIQKQWAIVRNVANVAFIIAFMVIVYSQITGTGINSYGIKRLLPRIIVAAILVNLSFWICTIAVDVSNIVGWNLKSLLTNAIPERESTFGWLDIMGMILTAQVTGGALVAAAAFSSTTALLSIALPIMISALFSILMIIFILIARQAIITILIVIAPLAFVAYLLPNTNKWFERWYGGFISMLMLYPLVALVFGGSQLAGSIVRLGDEGAVNDLGLSIFSLGIQALPLFIIPVLLKSTGGLLGKIGLLANDKTKGILDRAGNKGQQLIARKQKQLDANSFARRAGTKSYRKGLFGDVQRVRDGLGGGSSARKITAEAKDKMADSALDYAHKQHQNNYLQNYDNALAAAGGNEQLASVIQAGAVSAAEKQEKEAVEGLQTMYSNHSVDQLRSIVQRNKANPEKQHSLETAAALGKLAEMGDPNNYIDLADDYVRSGKSSPVTRALGRVEASNPLLGGGDKQAIRSGMLTQGYVAALDGGIKGLSSEGLASLGGGQISYVNKRAHESVDVARTVQTTAQTALNSNVSQKIGGHRATVTELATTAPRMAAAQFEREEAARQESEKIVQQTKETAESTKKVADMVEQTAKAQQQNSGNPPANNNQ